MVGWWFTRFTVTLTLNRWITDSAALLQWVKINTPNPGSSSFVMVRATALTRSTGALMLTSPRVEKQSQERNHDLLVSTEFA